MSVVIRTRPGDYVVRHTDPEFEGLLFEDVEFSVFCRSLPRSRITAVRAAHPQDTDEAREGIIDDLMFARIVSSEGFVDADGAPVSLADRESFDLFREWNPAFARALSDAMGRHESGLRASSEAARRD